MKRLSTASTSVYRKVQYEGILYPSLASKRAFKRKRTVGRKSIKRTMVWGFGEGRSEHLLRLAQRASCLVEKVGKVAEEGRVVRIDADRRFVPGAGCNRCRVDEEGRRGCGWVVECQ